MLLASIILNTKTANSTFGPSKTLVQSMVIRVASPSLLKPFVLLSQTITPQVLSFPPLLFFQKRVLDILLLLYFFAFFFQTHPKLIERETLDLSEFSRKLGHDSTNLSNPAVICEVFKIMEELCLDVRTLILSNNRIKSLQGFRSFPKTLKITALSLENNQIGEIKQIDCLSGMKLQMLLLFGNPIVQNMEDRLYRKSVTQKLVYLKNLDNKEVAGFDFAIPDHLQNPGAPQALPESRGSTFQLPIHQNVVNSFFQRFFDCIDNNRQNLYHAYHDFAVLSISVARHPTKDEGLNAYLEYDHNLIKCKEPKERLNRVVFNNKAGLVSRLVSLPNTRHSPESFVVDTVAMKVGQDDALCVMIQGSFLEVGSSISRSFSRTFVIIPQHDGGALIMNDQLLIRPYSVLKAKPPSMSMSSVFPLTQTISPISTSISLSPTRIPSLPPLSPSLSPSLSSSISPSKCLSAPPLPLSSPRSLSLRNNDMIDQFCRQCGVTADLAAQFLERSNWNMANALSAYISFSSKKI